MKRLTLAVLVLVLCFSALLFIAPSQSPTRVAWRAVQASAPQLVSKTDVETHAERVRPSADTLTLRLDTRLVSGDLACVLVDPNGEVRWTSRISGPALTQRTRSFEAIPGEWKLKVALAECSGAYEVAWGSD